MSPDVVLVFREKGLEAYHINELKSHSKQRVVDDQLRRLTIQKGYIIVTKDDDFVRSFVSRKVPEKIIFLYGLDSKVMLLKRMKEIVDELEGWLFMHDFIEVRESEVRFPFS